jgi:hypothetical protein
MIVQFATEQEALATDEGDRAYRRNCARLIDKARKAGLRDTLRYPWRASETAVIACCRALMRSDER